MCLQAGSDSKLMKTDSSSSLQNIETETDCGDDDARAVTSCNGGGAGDHNSKLVNGQHSPMRGGNSADSKNVCSCTLIAVFAVCLLGW